MQPPAANVESLAGLIERVTYQNEDTGFAVIKAKVKGQRDLVTVVGVAPTVNPGEWINAEGQWIRDREFGLQFKASTLTSTPPTTKEGIERYLGSGMIKGIGPVYAKKLVDKFGDKIFDIIETTSVRLEEVDGIGPTRRKKIKDAWAEQRVIREIMVFLHSHGVSTSRAVRIYKTYGDAAVEKVRDNPYVLAKDIHGIGFKTADQIAQKLGIPFDSLKRACAGLSHVLLEATSNGHCCLPLMMIKEEAGKLLLVDEAVVDAALERTLNNGDLVVEKVEDGSFIFLPNLKKAEELIAARIKSLAVESSNYPLIDVEKALEWVQQKTNKQLAPTQQAALKQAMTNRCLIITGGPGVGKTTLVNSILLILRAKKMKCLLCAPTGRAAKRLSETTGLEAKTIHRMLEVNPKTGGFLRMEANPLECDLLVVDEVSMVDVPLMSSLMRALPLNASLILVGDIDQLPSVGPGAVLNDLIESNVIPTVRLTEVFRQAAHSRIITNAHRINEGLMPEFAAAKEETDFYFVEREEPELISKTLIDMVKSRIPAKFKLDPMRLLEADAALGIESLQQMLNEQAGSIDATILRVEPQLPFKGVGFRFKEPAFHRFLEFFGKIGGRLVLMPHLNGFLVQLDCVFQRSVIGQTHHDAEVGEVIGRGKFGLRFMGEAANQKDRRPVERGLCALQCQAAFGVDLDLE